MPSGGHGGSAGSSVPSMGPSFGSKAPKGPKFLPKNYAKAPDKAGVIYSLEHFDFHSKNVPSKYS